MFDIKWIRDNPEAFDKGLVSRGVEASSAELIKLDSKWRGAQTSLQNLQKLRTSSARAIGLAKQKGEDLSPLLSEIETLKEKFRTCEEEEKVARERLNFILSGFPNIPSADVPDGLSEVDNIEVRRWGNREPECKSSVSTHYEIGEAMELMDFRKAAKISGSRFVVLYGDLALLERALSSFMLDLHTGEHGYVEVAPPLLVRESTAYGTGNLPKFKDDLFKTIDDYWLIPTAEMPLTNLVAGEILNIEQLPLRYTAYTQCFRAEAGAAGRDTRGMIRQHQFGKVELVSIVPADCSSTEHDRMTACAEVVLKRLDLPFRTMLLSAGDMGFSACKTFDIEVWLPGEGNYREISSCSNCGDFQARRMNARFKRKDVKGTQFLHTLNGSALAVGRTLIAVLENYQNPDGSVTIPEVLRGRMGGRERIS